MAVYKRGDCDLYSYDFHKDGKRYAGPTGTADLEEARRIEATVKGGIAAINPFCLSIIRRARRSLPQRPNAKNGYIYMLKSNYFIKIGQTINPAERLKAIQTASPDGCELLFAIPGDLRLERMLHAEFEACHFRGEWYFFCGKLKRFVEEVLATDASPIAGSITDTPPNRTSDYTGY